MGLTDSEYRSSAFAEEDYGNTAQSREQKAYDFNEDFNSLSYNRNECLR